MIYCVIPHGLSGELHEQLRTFYGGDRFVEVVVDLRSAERRGGADPRTSTARGSRRERRRANRRRAADRRAVVSSAQPVRLPPLSKAYAKRVTYVRLHAVGGKVGEELESGRLAERAGGGDGGAFETLYLRYFDRVYTQLAITLNRHEAEDATQEVFTRLLNSLASYDAAKAPFRSWLHVITRNVGLTRLEGLERQDAILEDPDEVLALREREVSGAATDPADLFDRDTLYIAERLPMDQRRVIGLRYVMDMEQTETAAVIGRSPGAVEKLEKRAKASIEARLRPIAAEALRRQRLPMVVRLKPQPVMAARRFALASARPGHRRW